MNKTTTSTATQRRYDFVPGDVFGDIHMHDIVGPGSDLWVLDDATRFELPKSVGDAMYKALSINAAVHHGKNPIPMSKKIAYCVNTKDDEILGEITAVQLLYMYHEAWFMVTANPVREKFEGNHYTAKVGFEHGLIEISGTMIFVLGTIAELSLRGGVVATEMSDELTKAVEDAKKRCQEKEDEFLDDEPNPNNSDGLSNRQLRERWADDAEKEQARWI